LHARIGIIYILLCIYIHYLKMCWVNLQCVLCNLILCEEKLAEKKMYLGIVFSDINIMYIMNVDASQINPHTNIELYFMILFYIILF